GGRAPADRRLPGHDARAVDEDVPRAPRRARRALRHRGRVHRRALARWLHRGRHRRRLRADLELLRRRRDEAGMNRMPIGLTVVAIVLAGLLSAGALAPPAAQDLRLPPSFDGAAALIELARRLRERPREYTYWVAWFDGEEARESWTATDSLYGSRRMASELGKSRRLPSAVIVADMIGDRDLAIRRESGSTSWLTDVIWASAARLGYSTHFLQDSLAVEDDHAPFIRLGIPATLLID